MRQLKNFLVLSLIFTPFVLYAQEKYITVFEKSEGNETATYNQVVEYYEQLSAAFPEVTVIKKGLTDSGHPLHLIRISNSGGEKLRLLINNGIHPGEPDGIDASMMLARDLVQTKSHLLDDFDLFIIPVYNIGGALNRNRTYRVNQNGPEEIGFRGNARNYDLNRDFIKADTRNTLSFYEIFHEVQPDIFIDTHVSNGADYQYNITHLFTQHNKLNSETGRFLHQEFMPEIEARMQEKNDPLTPYVNVFGRTPDSGFSQFMDWPRYSSGYAALFNCLGMMIETHMLKPYPVRVKSTYDFLISTMDAGRVYKHKIHEFRSDSTWWPKGKYPLDWKLVENKADTLDFHGYTGEILNSKVTGLPRLFYDEEKPFERKIPYYDHYNPELFVEAPDAYIIPQGWHNVIDLLLLNKAGFSRLEKDSTIEVEVYVIKNYDTSSKPYEGHYPHSKVEVEKLLQKVKFQKGDYIFPVYQKASRYLIEALEPQGHDSFFTWNFFDTILQRKEGFSPYVFEEIAEGLLLKRPELRKQLDSLKVENVDFRENAFQQLQFIYENSEYAEESFMRYPVYRLMGGEDK